MLFQDMILNLSQFWANQGCVVLTPYHTEVGAGTSNPATFLRVLGPEPWKTMYVEPSIRPTDGRYGENPNRLQHFLQIQVILKPAPDNVQDLFLQSLECIGLDLHKHDFRFVEDNWQSPSLGAWGVGWEAWLDGMEILQFTYFQECGGVKLRPKACELTYGIERIATYIQKKASVYDLEWAPGVSYGDVYRQSEIEYCHYNFDQANVDLLFQNFEKYEGEANRLLDEGLLMPAYDYCLRCSHAFNVLDARGSFSAAERGRFLLRNRAIAQRCAEAYVNQREELGHPMVKPWSGEKSEKKESTFEVSASPQDLVLEIGVEELPHGHLECAREHFPQAVEKQLKSKGLSFEKITCHTTPRRLVAIVEKLAGRQKDKTVEARGPKAKALKDGDGNWTMAAKKFVEAKGATVDDIEIKKQGKHEYAFVNVHVKGKSLPELVSPMLVAILKAIPFSKTMSWDDNTFIFSRPIRWLLALHGEQVLPIELQLRPEDDNGPAVYLNSGRKTYGHRRLTEGAIEVKSCADYVSALRDKLVIVDRDERRALLIKQLHDCASKKDLVFDEKGEAELIEEVTDLVERPNALVGTIPESALNLKEEIVVTPMREHQRYFPLRNQDGSLSRHFVCVANGDFSKDEEAQEVIVSGNEKVLNARLRDAVFFWDSDREKKLAEHAAKLDTIVFHKKLGTYADKVARLHKLADELKEMLPAGVNAEELKEVISLMKADLTTQMVFEFTSLEGLVGKLYGESEGLKESVSTALFEHRLPRRAGDILPKTPLGAAAGLIDRLDSLIGYLGIGQKPSGSRDPLGLRRLALGFLAVANEFSLDVELDKWAEVAAKVYGSEFVPKPEATVGTFVEFISERLALQAKDDGAAHSLVQAAMEAHRKAPGTFASCLKALQEADEALIQDLAEHTKRMVKIAKEPAEKLDPALYSYETEKGLAKLLEEPAERVKEALDKKDFKNCLQECSHFVPVIVDFFEEVLVNDKDDAVRRNRHLLVKSVADVLVSVADFSLVEKKG